MDFTFVGSQGVYGIPEHASSFALATTVFVSSFYFIFIFKEINFNCNHRGKTDPYRFYNLDVFEYELQETMALYGSIPFMISQKQGKSTAIFWLNSSETWVDIDNNPKGSHNVLFYCILNLKYYISIITYILKIGKQKNRNTLV